MEAAADPFDLENFISKRGIPHLAAEQLAHLVLRGWTVAEIQRVLDKVDGLHKGFDKLRTVHREASWTNPSSWRWVQASFDLMSQAAKESKALCVNARGEFALLTDGYIAVSHASVEGMFEDPSNRGLPRSVIIELFKLLASVGAEWVWIDSLSIPGGRGDLSVDEERLKNDLINMMGAIYGKASRVIALDALVMHLDSQDPVDVAVAILLGRWARRLWCYQEGRFAKQLTVLTRTGTIDMTDLLTRLRKAQVTHPRDLSYLISHLAAMAPAKKVRPKLTSTAATFYAREAGLPIDYARSLFPVLGITWDERLSRDEAMATIYHTYPDEAVQLICTFGSPRLINGPGWAPALIVGTVVQPIRGLRWIPAGVDGQWCIYKVCTASMDQQTNGPPRMKAIIEQKSGQDVVLFLLTAFQEKQTTRQNYISASSAGDAYLLAPEPLRPMNINCIPDAKILLLAEKMPAEAVDTYRVHLTAMVGEIGRIETVAKQRVLISNKSPQHKDAGRPPDFVIKALKAMTTTVDFDSHTGTPLHEAVREGDVSAVNRLIAASSTVARLVNAQDSIGWTPLHWAVAGNHEHALKIAKTLIQAGTSLNPSSSSSTGDVKSPLLLAIEFAPNTIIHHLLSHGAQPTVSANIDTVAQAIHSHRSPDILTALLSHNTSPDAPTHSLPPLFFALTSPASETILPLLLSHKPSAANPNAILPNGRSLLHEAALLNAVPAIHALISHGAYVDILSNETPSTVSRPTNTGCTPLTYAITHAHLPAVQALLAHQANANFRAPGGPQSEKAEQQPLLNLAASLPRHSSLPITTSLLSHHARADVWSAPSLLTPLHIAARNGDFSLVNLLLEEADSKFTVFRKDREGRTPRDYAIGLGKKGEQVERVIWRRMEREEGGTSSQVVGALVLGPLFGGLVWRAWRAMDGGGSGGSADAGKVKGHGNGEGEELMGPRAGGGGWSGNVMRGFGPGSALVLALSGLLILGAVNSWHSERKVERFSVQTRWRERWTNKPQETAKKDWTGEVALLVVFGLYPAGTWYWGSALQTYGGVVSMISCSVGLVMMFWRADKVHKSSVRYGAVLFLSWIWIVALTPRFWPRIVGVAPWARLGAILGPVMTVLVLGLPAFIWASLTANNGKRSEKQNDDWVLKTGIGLATLASQWAVLWLLVFYLGWLVLVMFMQLFTIVSILLGEERFGKMSQGLGPKGGAVMFGVYLAMSAILVFVGSNFVVDVSCIAGFLVGSWKLYKIVDEASKNPKGFELPSAGYAYGFAVAMTLWRLILVATRLWDG